MRLWTQAVVAIGLAGVALAGAAAFVPAAGPVIDRLGLGALFDRLGVTTAEDDEAPEWGGEGDGAAPVPVIAVQPEMRPAHSSVAAIGSARSAQSVSVAARLMGRIGQVEVASGDRVEAGAVIARLESDSARIALERAQVELAQAQSDFERTERLRAAGSGTDIQRQQTEVALRQAELDLREAEYVLGQHRIIAPIGGWIGIIDAVPGRLVAAGEEIAHIEDRSRLLVDFRVPERVVSLLERGAPVAAAPLSDPGQKLDGRIVALDNRVDPATRSLRVQASIDNAADRLRAGMAIGITLDFVGEPRPAVDPLAIQWDNEGSFVWAVRAGKALRLPVRILQREADFVLLEAEFAPGDLVVTEGAHALRPESDVTVLERQS